SIRKLKIKIYSYLLIFILIITLLSQINFTLTLNNEKKTMVLRLNNIYGDDDRTRISPTTSYPWSTIVKLYISWGSSNYIGSGVLIDKNHVLTAGHCVYYHAEGGWADSIKVVPGFDNGYEPYGHAWAIEMRSYDGWINYEYTQDDIGLITLDQDIGLQTGWMDIYTTVLSDPIYRGGLNLAGYPADLDDGLNLYWDYDYGRTVSIYNHWYYMDTAPGQSGSPVWIDNGTNCFILSVHTCGNDGSGSNHGTRININKFHSIKNWIFSDATSINKPDLTAGINSYSGSNITLIRPGYTNFRVQSEIHNAGTIISDPSTVSYYVSNDTLFSTTDYLIGTDNINSISPTNSIPSSWSGVFPGDIPTGSYYLGRIVDIDDNIDELNENNNIDYITNYKLWVDAVPPSNPDACVQTEGTTESDIWQNTIDNPYFIWSGASDEHTGIAGYYYYWGSYPNGTSNNFITSNHFEPAPVDTGIYYLRVCTKDKVGNNASWKTLYIFKYDNTSPTNPTNCLQINGLTQNNVWQATVDEPVFKWSGEIDHESQIDGYYIYWGEQPDGISSHFTPYPNFTSPIINSGIHYFRIQTKDRVGNLAPWSTQYIFKFDNTPPLNPSICEQLIGSTESDIWQDSINNPLFTWSNASDAHTNVLGYYVYWGTNPNGTSSNFTDSPFFIPLPVSTGIYYLRVRTKDLVGNNASWKTLYIFKYDSDLRKTPNNEPSQNGFFTLITLLEIAIASFAICAISLLVVKKRKRSWF
ncbi:MAG: trypsin-like serine protease, partial [Promethearchaeota archaeon]